MSFAKTALQTMALLLTAMPVLSAAAQPAPTAPPIAPPSAWQVSAGAVPGAVEIAATAKGGTAQFVGGCSTSPDPGLVGTFSGYTGTGLRTDGEIEHVAFYVRGGEWQDAFSVRLRYSAASHAWEFAKPLAPVFLNSFSRGAALANSRNQEIFAFDLTGSTAAARAIRTACQFEQG